MDMDTDVDVDASNNLMLPAQQTTNPLRMFTWAKDGSNVVLFAEFV